MTANLRPRILFVDDEPALLASVTATLRKRFEVITANDARSALDVLESDHEFPIVVSDYRMSGMNGAVFLARVRERFPRIVRILLTGAGAENDDITGDRDLVFRVLAKPCPRETLIQALEDGLSRWRAGV